MRVELFKSTNFAILNVFEDILGEICCHYSTVIHFFQLCCENSLLIFEIGRLLTKTPYLGSNSLNWEQLTRLYSDEMSCRMLRGVVQRAFPEELVAKMMNAQEYYVLLPLSVQHLSWEGPSTSAINLPVPYRLLILAEYHYVI